MKRFFFFLAITLLPLSCRKSDFVQIQGYAQGGIYTVKCGIDSDCLPSVKGGITFKAAYLKDGIDSILNCIDRSVSGYNAASLLSRYNNGETIMDDGSTEYAIFSNLTRYCDSLYLATDSALDTRAAAIYDIWGFGFKNGEMPSEEEVEKARSDRSKMNFNAVAQGYSTDMVAEYLKSYGITDMLVDIGGEMYCSGLNQSGKPWTIGIDTPRDGNMSPGKELSATFTVNRNCGVVTSGNYRKFYVRDGMKYSHTIDPRTGKPVTHNLLCATILAPTSALADALATYCMVVGMEEARKFILSRNDLEACLICSDSLWFSPGLEAQIKNIKKQNVTSGQ